MGTSVFIILGLLYGLQAQQELCTGGDSCCDGRVCGIGEGDCDRDSQCAGNLKCGTDNCVGKGFDSTDDCCYEDPDVPDPTTEPVGKEILHCEAILDAADFMYHTTVFQKCPKSHDVYPGIFDFSVDTCPGNTCIDNVLLSPLCHGLPPVLNCSEWQEMTRRLVNIATEFCPSGAYKTAIFGQEDCQAIDFAQQTASFATYVQGCDVPFFSRDNHGTGTVLQLGTCSKLSCLTGLFKQTPSCKQFSCGVYKRFTNMEKDLRRIKENNCKDFPEPRGDVTCNGGGCTQVVTTTEADGNTCFSSSSKITTYNGQTELKNLKLNDSVLTYTPGMGTHYTEFLGWLDRGYFNSFGTMLEIFTSNSSSITLSADHVLFKMSRNGAMESIFAKDIVQTDILIKPNENGEMQTEEVVEVMEVSVESYWAPLTADGTILVNGFLASCYAYFPHQIGEFFLAPLKRYPTVLLDDEKSQHENGVRKSVDVLMRLGKSLGLDGHDGQRQPMEEVKRKGQLYGLGGEDEDSLQQSMKVLTRLSSL